MATVPISTSLHSFSFPTTNHTLPRGSPSSVSFRRPLPSISAAYATVDAPSSSSRTTSFYDLLGVQHEANPKEIKAAYRRIARTVHPDVVATSSSADEFIRVHEAYSTLSDPQKRADYDKTLRRRFEYSTDYIYRGVSVSVSNYDTTSFSGFSRRNWETDQCW